MRVTVVCGNKQYDIDTKNEGSTVRGLKSAFARESRMDLNRVSLRIENSESKKDPTRLDDDSKELSSFGLRDGDRVIVKDLGPQIGYRTVFLLEYFGPLLFVLIYAAVRSQSPELIWSTNARQIKEPMCFVATLGVICWTAHFLKREFETIFIHKFSRPTMPLSNLFKNCAYYWTFGAVIGYPLCGPRYVEPSMEYVYTGFTVFALSELGNLICHIMLSRLRPKEGSKNRPIPSGFLFDYVACPNYTFEVLSWVGFSIMTNIWLSWLFTLVGFLQMTDWALKKHKEYKKSYPEYSKMKKKAIVPFVI